MRTWLIVVIALAACDAHKREQAPARAVHGARAVRVPMLSTAALELAWSYAESVGTGEAWDGAASQCEIALTRCIHDCRDLARTLVLARRNAARAEPAEPLKEGEPPAMPWREWKLVKAIDRFAEVADPDDPELPGIKFIAAASMARWRQPDAFPRLAAQMSDYPDDETAEYARNILLDLLRRGGNKRLDATLAR
jgi:hypothetical protein